MNKHKHILRRLLLGVALALGVLGVTAGSAAAQNVIQGYQSDQPLQNGMIVRLKPGDGTRVQAVSQKDEGEMLGVVVSPRDAPVSLSNTEAAQEIFVANYGRYDVLVSTQGGPIQTGDYITISSLGGVGMKANEKSRFVIGKALKGFAGTDNAEGNAQLKTSSGNQSVQLGRIPVELSVARNPMYHRDDQAGVPTFLRQIAETVTDKPVTAFRVYAGLAVVVVTVIVAGIILFAGVRTGMTAIGRNPLAKKSITRNLIQVTLMALIVFVIGAIAVYLLLRV